MKKVGALPGCPAFFYLWSRSNEPQAVKRKGTEERVHALIDDVVAREGYELVDLEFVTERGRPILRAYIDTVPPSTPERGVGVEDCSLISRVVGDIIDVEDVIPDEYNLEVSSPGIFRPLTKPEHFDRVVGERVKVKTYDKPFERKVFVGTLTQHAEAQITVEVDGQPFELALSGVAKANLEPLFDF